MCFFFFTVQIPWWWLIGFYILTIWYIASQPWFLQCVRLSMHKCVMLWLCVYFGDNIVCIIIKLSRHANNDEKMYCIDFRGQRLRSYSLIDKCLVYRGVTLSVPYVIDWCIKECVIHVVFWMFGGLCQPIHKIYCQFLVICLNYFLDICDCWHWKMHCINNFIKK